MYIREETQQALIEGRIPADAEELSYFLMMCILNYLEGNKKDEKNIANHLEILGVLEMLKIEFYRRFSTPVQEAKIINTGDIFPD
jgi:hypothetical protein